MIPSSRIWLIVIAALLVSVQILAMIIYAFSFVPLVWDETFLKGVEPERETLFYVILLGLSVGFSALGARMLLPRLQSPASILRFKRWVWLEALWCFLMVFCFFKWTTYRYAFWNILFYERSGWLVPFFWVVCAASVLSKMFYPELERAGAFIKTKLQEKHLVNVLAKPVQIGFIGGVFALLFVARPEDVVALALVFDQWKHLDQAAAGFMAQGFFLKYEHIIQILSLAAIAYSIAVFYLIRCMLNSWLLAVAGALLAIKLGMFYYGASPCVWINPNLSFLVHGWDMILLCGLWWVHQKHPRYFLKGVIVVVALLLVGWIKEGGYLIALGLDNQPMMAPLRVRQFFPFFMGFIIPVFYVFSLVFAEERFIKFLCAYGLWIFIDYVQSPVIGFYGALMVPAILIGMWWIAQALRARTTLFRRGIGFCLCLVVLGALLTNRLMLIYPNVLFQDQKRFERERYAYQHVNVLAPSAALIEQLVPPNQKAAVLSSFEMTLLMQAKRRPLFKETPVMISSDAQNIKGLGLKTSAQLEILMATLEQEQPTYVFVETRLWNLPTQRLGRWGITTLLDFMHEHYEVSQEQGILTAVRRKGSSK